MASKKVTELQAARISQLNLSPPVEQALRNVQAELAEAYRESFVEMVRAIENQASALRRIQETLSILVDRLAPDLGESAPAAFRVAGEGEEPDVAKALVVADPIGAGFTLSLTKLSQVLGVSMSDLGTFIRAIKFHDDSECAVVVRRGKSAHGRIVNYHRKAIERLREQITDSPLSRLQGNEQSALRRLKRDLKAQPRPSDD